jgi:hypothetical protein
MWLKSRKMNALLARLAAVIDGEISDGATKGFYRGYSVEARPHSGFPIQSWSIATTGESGPVDVNMLEVTLAGVAGSLWWRCQSSASSYSQDLASRFTAGALLNRFKPGEFKFEGVDTVKEATERVWAKALKPFVPMKADIDPVALHERLIAAGLFDELDALRLGGHPYLPKVQFTPGARAMSELNSYPAFGRGRPALEERLREAGVDYDSAMKAMIDKAEEHDRGRLRLDVEAGEAKVPSAERFRDVLEHAVRIAQISAKVNNASAEST